MISNIFWGFLILDTIGIAILAVLATRGPSSPEGPVGGWLLFIPPILIIGMAAAVLITKSDTVRMVGIYVLGFPWIGIILGPAYTAYEKYQTERSIAGDNDFSGVARQLAHAITARDVTLVRSLIPKAGDLNKLHGDETLLLFALQKARDVVHPEGPVPPPSTEIVKALLEAGANPNKENPNRYRPLSAAMYGGPELTILLLQAGADPNPLDDSKRPLWWGVLSDDTDRGIEMLKILLDHGANVALRDGEGGPLGWAAYQARAKYVSSWRAAWMLVERGAAWRDEKEFGRSVEEMIAQEVEDRTRQKQEIPEALEKLRLKYAGRQIP